MGASYSLRIDACRPFWISNYHLTTVFSIHECLFFPLVSLEKAVSLLDIMIFNIILSFVTSIRILQCAVQYATPQITRKLYKTTHKKVKSPILFFDRNILGVSISVELCGLVSQQSLAVSLN